MFKKPLCLSILITILLLYACFPRPASQPDAGGLFLQPDNEASDNNLPIEGTLTEETLDNKTSAPLLTSPPLSSEEVENKIIDDMLSTMTTDEKIGQLLVCRLPNGATSVTEAVKKMIDELHIGGFILFSENIQSIEQVQGLTKSLRAYSPVPLFIATDEEGGRVSRIGKLYEETIPPAYTLAKDGDTDAVYQAARLIGDRLISLGIDMDFAPVADIWSNNANTVIGDRAYGKDPFTTAVMTEAAILGLREAGVLSVIKHFPGHGDTAEDSHAQLAVYPYDRERFDTFELLPFRQGITSGADGVMVGHIATPLLQKDSAVLGWMNPSLESGRLPAIFSDYWMMDVLREELSFDGLIITDGLEMKAVTANYTNAQIAVGAFIAGADILLIPQNPAEAVTALLDAYNQGMFNDERLDASVRRILRAKLN